MIDVGGTNLPKAISSKSGAKLGQLYKKRGMNQTIVSTLKQLYAALNVKPVIKQLNENTIEVILKFSKKFCPIGGTYNPTRASIFQENVCIPYTKGFLNEIFPQYMYESDILNCFPLSNHRTCHYILKLKKKSNASL
ncbi:MAG: hypothetical protein JSV62_00940 [Promethearchaeota archaeon]|nr:MAG: hypothetical protein JSV62_00940 [Candidatus Lokiarchaeota archaeon]